MKRLILFALLTASSIPSRGWSITRAEVITAATEEAGNSYSSADAGTMEILDNVFHPYYLFGQCGGHCIDHIYTDWPFYDGNPLQHSWYGAPYCYGGTRMGDDCQSKITSGYGVGATTCHYNINGGTNSWAAGIDCSHFVCQCLGISFSDTNNLPNECAAITWDELQPGDLLINPGSHVMMFKQWDGSDKSNYTVIHASNTNDEERSSRVWVERSRDTTSDGNAGFKPYTPNCISGDPVAKLAGFKIENEGGAPLLIWETECERDTRVFWVERSLSLDGSWEKITESIPGRGTNTTGAEYQLSDPAYPGGRVYYRLVEQEIGWRVIVKRVEMFEQY